MTLLGQRREISDWYESFFGLRNSLVHGDVEPASFLYMRGQSRIGNRPHLLLARRVFLACAELILACAERQPLFGFEDELIPNEVRVDETIKSLRSARNITWAELVERDLLKPLRSLRTDDLTSVKTKALELGRLLLPYARAELAGSKVIPQYDGVIAQIDLILSKVAAKDANVLAVAYSTLKAGYQHAYFEQRNYDTTSAFRAAVYSFIDYAAWRLHVFRD